MFKHYNLDEGKRSDIMGSTYLYSLFENMDALHI
jgi:hypothetical protein